MLSRMANGEQRPQVKITYQVAPSVNSPPGVSATADQLVDGRWKHVLVNDRPIELIASTENGARNRVLIALNTLFGDGGYDLAN